MGKQAWRVRRSGFAGARVAALEDVRGGSGLLGEGWRGEKLFSRLVRKARVVGREVGGRDIYDLGGLKCRGLSRVGGAARLGEARI